jgi:hypothetical protein
MTWQCASEQSDLLGRGARPRTTTDVAAFAAGRSFGIHHKYNVRPRGSGGLSSG